MRHSLKAALLATLVFSAHAVAQAQTTRSMTPPIMLEVVDGRLVVSNGAYQLAASQTVTTWQMLTPGWRFSAGSIRFENAGAPFSCAPYAEGAAMRCTTGGDVRGRFAYSIALVEEGGRLMALPQPSIYISLD